MEKTEKEGKYRRVTIEVEFRDEAHTLSDSTIQNKVNQFFGRGEFGRQDFTVELLRHSFEQLLQDCLYEAITEEEFEKPGANEDIQISEQVWIDKGSLEAEKRKDEADVLITGMFEAKVISADELKRRE